MKQTPPALPELFVKRILGEFGMEEGGLLLESLNQSPAVSVSKKSKEAIWESEGAVPHFPLGVYLTERPVFTLDPLFHLGHYYPQESSSMFVYQIAQLLAQTTDIQYVIDLCASPGGKTRLLHQALPQARMIVSNEVQAKRNVILCENVIKFGDTRSVVTQSPASQIGGDGQWDLVLLDAPCSGEGMFRKDHSARQEWSMENVLNCQKTQHGLLKEAERLVRPGGFLIYSTCTFSKEENENQCQLLMKSGEWENWSDFELANGAVWKAGRDFRAIHFLPHMSQGEGFFCAVFKRRESTVRTKKVVLKNKISNKFQNLQRNRLEKISGYLRTEASSYWESSLNEVFAFTGDIHMIDWLDRPRMVGIPLGSFIKDKFVPQQGLITTGLYHPDIPQLQVDLEEALNLLRGHDWRWDFDGAPGWYLANWNGMPLAWLKWVGNRFSNHYPMDWRIRKL